VRYQSFKDSNELRAALMKKCAAALSPGGALRRFQVSCQD
jgi:hypothetical protein